MGGKCKFCAYHRNISALEFHHRNPKSKKFSLNLSRLRSLSWESCLLEARKCDLLCANCHRELHNLNYSENLR